MKRKTTLIAAVLLASTAINAQAGHNDSKSRDYGDAGPARYRDTARVIDVEPIVRWQRVAVERRVCEPKRYRRSHGRDRHSNNGYYDNDDNALVPTVLGGVIGAVLGSQVNHRGARVVTTAAGSVVGAALGYGLSQASYDGGHNGRHKRHHRQNKRCRTVTEYERRRHVDGYRVTYRYRGHEFVTRTDTHPGRRIPVRIKLRPDF